jgi:hypothetical protein
MAKKAPKKALTKVTSAVKRTASKVTATLRKAKEKVTREEKPAPLPRMATKSAPKPAPTARRKRTTTDVAPEVLARTLTPKTNMKAGFRASGVDQTRDQEMSRGFSDERWNDEDRLTNKSGDPRIGTHGRTYEPGE